MSDNNTTTGGVGFLGLLGLVFITLKLCGIIDWEWWIVLSPIWVPIVLAFLVLVGAFLWECLKDLLRG